MRFLDLVMSALSQPVEVMFAHLRAFNDGASHDVPQGVFTCRKP
jgi:hypothetical protein